MRNNDIANKLYDIIEVPICTGSPTRGSEFAYQSLKNNGISMCFDNCASFIDCAVDLDFDDEYPDNLKYLNTVVKASSYLKDAVVSSVSSGKIPVVVGGDHSIVMGSLAALNELYGAENIAVVYIDAHADINTETSTLTGYIHGMPLAASLGLCCDDLCIGSVKKKISGNNIHIIGARSIDEGEWPIIRSESVDLHTSNDCEAHGISHIIDELIPRLKGKKVHISFDVDSLDPDEFSSTGYLIKNGLSLSDVSKIIAEVSSNSDVVSFECVEYNPTLDKDNIDLNKLLNIFNVFYKATTKKGEAN